MKGRGYSPRTVAAVIVAGMLGGAVLLGIEGGQWITQLGARYPYLFGDMTGACYVGRDRCSELLAFECKALAQGRDENILYYKGSKCSNQPGWLVLSEKATATFDEYRFGSRLSNPLMEKWVFQRAAGRCHEQLVRKLRSSESSVCPPGKYVHLEQPSTITKREFESSKATVYCAAVARCVDFEPRG